MYLLSMVSGMILCSSHCACIRHNLTQSQCKKVYSSVIEYGLLGMFVFKENSFEYKHI